MKERMEEIKIIMAELDCDEDTAKEQFGINQVMEEIECDADTAEIMFHKDIMEKYHEDDEDVALQLYITDPELWGELENDNNIAIDSNAKLKIQRGEVTNVAVQAVSNYVKALPLSVEQNDRLVGMLTAMLATAESEQYLKGFDEGLKFSNSLND